LDLRIRINLTKYKQTREVCNEVYEQEEDLSISENAKTKEGKKEKKKRNKYIKKEKTKKERKG
jgi:hypothetical protein